MGCCAWPQLLLSPLFSPEAGLVLTIRALDTRIMLDTIHEVLSYVEYEPKRLLSSFKAIVETAVKKGKVSPADRRQMIKAYTDSLNGYTYFEHSDH